ncbi:cyclin-Q isoform X2 [Parasteatoda tepidariorum]|nr:cyclin-Q isoform X2 [Parasteatoda tepidariorum]
MVAAAAVSLASRINEQVLDQDTILLTFFCIANKTSRVLKAEDSEFLVLKNTLVTLDYVMMRTLDFDLNHKLAHQYLVPYLHVIFSRSWKVSQFSGEISNTCIRLISDFYLHRTCLNYQADHIAIACIDATLYIYGLYDEMEMIQPWYKGFCKDLDDKKIDEIQDNMFTLYEAFANESSKEMKNVASVAVTS